MQRWVILYNNKLSTKDNFLENTHFIDYLARVNLSGMHKGSSICDTLAKKMQNLQSAAYKLIILRLRRHLYIDYNRQVATYIFLNFWPNKDIKQKMLIFAINNSLF